MADNTVHITLSPATSYATRPNIKFPGSTTKATAAATAADTRIEDGVPSGVTIAGLSVTSNGES